MALQLSSPAQTHFESDHCGDRSTQFSSLLNRKHEGQRVATRCLQSLRDFKSCLWLLFAIFPCQLPPSIDNLMILNRLKKLGSLIKNCTRTTHPNNLVTFSLNIETMKFTLYVRVMVNELFSLVICSSRESRLGPGMFFTPPLQKYNSRSSRGLNVIKNKVERSD